MIKYFIFIVLVLLIGCSSQEVVIDVETDKVDVEAEAMSDDLIKDEISEELQTDGYNDYRDFALSDLNNNLGFNYEMANTTQEIYQNQVNAADKNNYISRSTCKISIIWK